MIDIFYWCTVILVGLIIGFQMSESHMRDKLIDCAKQNNVYACEYVAVPKEGVE